MIRSAAIRAAAFEEDCTLQVPGVCRNDTRTTVACHSNFGEDGHGKGIKADDIFVAFGCFHCHQWLDEGRAPNMEKRDVFHRGMKRTWKRLVEKGIIIIKGAKQ